MTIGYDNKRNNEGDKMKILSGDFVAEYNRALRFLKEEQAQLDAKYEDVMKKIVEREENRLEDVASPSFPFFKAGDNVKTLEGRKGKIHSLCVVIDPTREPGYDDVEHYGPGKYFELKDDKDEYIFACKDIIYRYDVEVEASEIEQDWGKETKIHRFYADELSIDKDNS